MELKIWNSCPASLHSSRDSPAQLESQLAGLIIRTSPLRLYQRMLRAPKDRGRQIDTWLWNHWNCFLINDCTPGRIKTRNCFPCNLTAGSKSLEGRLYSTHLFLDSGGLQYWTKEHNIKLKGQNNLSQPVTCLPGLYILVEEMDHSK